MKYGYVYKTTNLINGKIYIGQHNKSSFDEKYYGSGTRMRKLINDFGISNLSNEVIAWADTPDELNELETFFIMKYKSYDNEIGYNISLGASGDTTYGLDDFEYSIQREKLSGENNGMYKSGERGIHPKGFKGHHHSKASRESISKHTKGIKNGFYGRSWEEYGGHPKGFEGHHHKESTNWKHQVSTHVILPNGKEFDFSNLSKASRELNIPRNVLQNSLDKNKPYKNSMPGKYPDYDNYNGLIVTKL